MGLSRFCSGVLGLGDIRVGVLALGGLSRFCSGVLRSGVFRSGVGCGSSEGGGISKRCTILVDCVVSCGLFLFVASGGRGV